MLFSNRDFYIKNGEILPKDQFILPERSDAIIYEVIRVIDNVPIFLSDHLNRLKISLDRMGIKYSSMLELEIIKNDIELLLKSNNFVDGNFKYSIYIQSDTFDRYALYIPHQYPDETMLTKGVALGTMHALRLEPNLKIVHSSINKDVEVLLKNNEYYEILLLNDSACITEGSRSNIFFVRDDTLITAPDDAVLKGITRQYVIKLAEEEKIPILFRSIKYLQLKQYDAVFLTGTSPKILPVSKIDQFCFNVNNLITNRLIKAYNDLLYSYIKSNTFSIDV
jgi:branched-chain amino acid aminotransferase